MRTPARVFGLLFATIATFSVGTAAAMADTPTGSAWPDPDSRSKLGDLVFFGGFTLGLFVLIVVFGMLTARRNYTPPAPGKEIHVAGEKAPAEH